MDKIVAIIPARYGSSRFPGKPLVNLLGKPMVIRVLEIVSKVVGIKNTFVATDDARIAKVSESNGFRAIITSKEHFTGTDRLAEAAKKIEADIFVNVQGDEPTIIPAFIEQVIKAKQKYKDYVVNAMAEMKQGDNPNDTNIPKVIFNQSREMIYMSRLAIPGFKSVKNKPKKYYKQVCIYAFTREQLLAFGNMREKGAVEKSEDIEILRFLELNIPVKMVEINKGTYSVDTIEDIPIVEKRLKQIYKI